MAGTQEFSSLEQAVVALRSGGVVAYPTEAVFGLGCDPRNERAVSRVFALKERPPQQGVLLIAADFEQLRPYIGPAPAAAIERASATWPGPYTWVLPRSATTPAWLAGAHAGIALRVTAHAPAVALCKAFGGAIVSTSANRHGQSPARSARQVRSDFGDDLVCIIDGPLGGLEQPTPIRDAMTGDVFRV